MPKSKFLELFEEAIRTKNFNNIIPLLKNKKTNISVGGDFPLLWICENNRLDLLEILLQHPNADPSTRSCMALGKAMGGNYCHINIIKRLLQDSRFEFIGSLSDSYLSLAYCYKYLDVAELIIQHPTFKPINTNRDVLPIAKASKNGHLFAVNYLLDQFNVDPSSHDNIALIWAVSEGHIDVINRLLEDPRVDPSKSLRQAIIKNNYNIVKRLLEDPRIDPSINSNEAIRESTFYGYNDITEYLLQDIRVKNKLRERIEYLNTMTVKELKSICKEYMIPYSNMTKEELVESIKFRDENIEPDFMKQLYISYQKVKK
jgi:hypothetical protein